LPSLLLGLISSLLLLTGCASLGGRTIELNQPQVPPCPVPDEYVSGELYYVSAKYPSTYDFIARLVVHCEAIDILREDYSNGE
jgi:hypothetical protein